MILSISGQTRLFLLTIMMGFLIGFMFDIFRIIRKTFKHPSFLIQLEDILYWISASFVMFYFILNQNDGELRPFSIFGTFLGMALYFLTLSFVVMKVSMTVINFIKKVLAIALKIILFPFKVIINILKIPAGYAAMLFQKIKNPSKKVLQKSRRYAKMRSAKFIKNFKIALKKI